MAICAAQRAAQQRLAYAFRVAISQRAKSELGGLIWGLLAIALSTLVSWPARAHSQPTDLIMIYLLGVVIVATRFSVIVSLVTALCATALFDFLFIPPLMVFTAPDPNNLVIFLVMPVVAAVVSVLNKRLRQERALARRGEENTRTLHSLASAVQRAELEVETERMRNALLSAVSHDLKTPLAAIIAAGSTLRDPEACLDEVTRAELLNTIVEAAERLDGVVTNLLSATRLDSGRLVISTAAEEVEELIGAVLSRFSERLRQRAVTLDVPKDLPQVRVDAQLIELVLINLMENALRYTSEGTPLHIRAGVSPAGVVVEVADEGPGISPDELEKVFEKFYRGGAARKNDGGTGLGLMICRAAILAHGGRIAAKQRPGGGATIEFSLPISGPTPNRSSLGT